jgi:hypothetical protein
METKLISKNVRIVRMLKKPVWLRVAAIRHTACLWEDDRGFGNTS